MAGFSTKNLLLLGFLFAAASLLIASAARDLQAEAAAPDGFKENYYGGGGGGGDGGGYYGHDPYYGYDHGPYYGHPPYHGHDLYYTGGNGCVEYGSGLFGEVSVDVADCEMREDEDYWGILAYV
ncbi:hypothetical protein Dimus_037572, partial [Dionaea muscipula]